MLIFNLIFYINYAISRYVNYQEYGEIYLIVDRPISKILNEDGTSNTEVSFKNDTFINIYKYEFIIWDQFFPRPLIYKIRFENKEDSAEKRELFLECYNTDDEMIFAFKTEEYTGVFKPPVFYDNKKNNINIKSQDTTYHEYVISKEEGDTECIINSLNYFEKLEENKYYYSSLLNKFDEILKHLKDFSSRITNYKVNDEQISIKIWEIRKSVIKLKNGLIKNQALLKLPSFNFVNFVNCFDNYFKKNINELIRMSNFLTKMVNGYISGHSNQNDFFLLKYYLEKTVSIIKEFNSDEMKLKSFDFNNYIKYLNSVLRFIQEKKDKNVINTQITFDCVTEKVDSFIEKYSQLLIEYCNILEKCDEICLYEYFYHKNNKKEDYDFKDLLESTLSDFLIAKAIKIYIQNYHQNDKTAFLIFSQTVYFNKHLSSRIKKNLDNLLFSSWFKEKFNNDTEGIKMDFSENDQKLIDVIGGFRKKFLPMLYGSIDTKTLLPFSKIIDNMPSKTSNKKTSEKQNQSVTDIGENYIYIVKGKEQNSESNKNMQDKTINTFYEYLTNNKIELDEDLNHNENKLNEEHTSSEEPKLKEEHTSSEEPIKHGSSKNDNSENNEDIKDSPSKEDNSMLLYVFAAVLVVLIGIIIYFVALRNKTS